MLIPRERSSCGTCAVRRFEVRGADEPRASLAGIGVREDMGDPPAVFGRSNLRKFRRDVPGCAKRECEDRQRGIETAVRHMD